MQTTYYVCQADDRSTWIALSYHPRGTVVRRVLADRAGCRDGVSSFAEQMPNSTVRPADRDQTRWARTIWRARQADDLGWSVLG
jgi:hypothetical protein